MGNTCAGMCRRSVSCASAMPPRDARQTTRRSRLMGPAAAGAAAGSLPARPPATLDPQISMYQAPGTRLSEGCMPNRQGFGHARAYKLGVPNVWGIAVSLRTWLQAGQCCLADRSTSMPCY